jgi:hypothetical protein
MNKHKKRSILDALPYKALEVDRDQNLSYFLCAALGRPIYYRCRRPHYASSGVRGWRQEIERMSLKDIFRVMRLGRRVIFMRHTYATPLTTSVLLDRIGSIFSLASDIPNQQTSIPQPNPSLRYRGIETSGDTLAQMIRDTEQAQHYISTMTEPYTWFDDEPSDATEQWTTRYRNTTISMNPAMTFDTAAEEPSDD